MNKLFTKRILLLIGFLLIISIVLIFNFFNSVAKISISTEKNAEVFVANSQNGDYISMGKGNVIKKVRKIPSKLYVRVVEGNNVSISGVSITNKKPKKLHLPIENIESSELLYEGGVKYPFISGDRVSGIEPKTSAPISFGVSTYSSSRSSFIGLPFLKKIMWLDYDNFVYSSYKNGVGVFKDNKRLSNYLVGSRVQLLNGQENNALSNTGEGNEISQNLIDIAKGLGNEMYFIDKSSLYKSSDMGINLIQIALTGGQDEESSIESSASNIFIFNKELPTVYADETGKSIKHNDNLKNLELSSISQYDFNGKLINNFSSESKQIIGAASDSKTNYVLLSNEILKIEGADFNNMPLHSTSNAGIISFKNRHYVLSGDGLWKISADGTSLSLVTKLPSSQIGLQNSMMIHDSKLIYSTTSFSSSNSNTYYVR